jgi:CHAT domain-containing protein/tetratricopeptide (TPR) repeat protein
LKKARILACCLLAVSLVGGARKSTPNPRPLTLRYAEQRANLVTPLRSRLRQGGDLFRSGEYSEAAQIFQLVFQTAQALALSDVAGRALGDWGGCQYAVHQYQAALGSFLTARQLSISGGDPGSAAVWEADIASLYSEMGEIEAAAQWIERSMKEVRGPGIGEHLPELQLQLAMLRARQGRMAEAAELFRKGIDGADQHGNLDLYARGWNSWGDALLNRGELPGAEAALLEAYRVRKLHQLPLESSYRGLGRLRQAQGDLASASALLDVAVGLTTQPYGIAPSWNLYHARGRVRLAQGRLAEALDDLRIALRLGRAWRWSAPDDDASRVGNEGMLDQVHSALVEAGNRLYLETHDAGLARETFAADEENRAVSLRALIPDPKQSRPDLSPAYWEAIGRLQRAEAAALRGVGSGDIPAARAQLVRLEASLGSELRPVPPNLAEATREQLDPDSAFFSFHLGDAASWVWALDRDGIEVYALPPREVIEPQSRALLAALREDRPDATSLSAALFRTLFGPVALRFRRAPRWLVALDETLFDIPVPALVETLAPGPTYVTERHIVEVVPGAAYLLDSAKRSEPELAPLFVGVGDAIYNRADARLARVSEGGDDALPLPRLVASGAEIDASARAWEGPAVLLRGGDASREKLMDQLKRRPAAVHLATHYLESAAAPGYALIALSLSPGGQAQLLTPFEISHWHIDAGMVVLSGCHSAAGAALPGTGVMGLTRAWLAAGAHSVVGTLWNTPDDDGDLFRALYQSLRRSVTFDAARALRDAQLEMIHSTGRRARPAYWGAYFVIGNQGKAVLPL